MGWSGLTSAASTPEPASPPAVSIRFPSCFRGTRFAFVDACFGTLTAVEEGQVMVSDLTAEEEIELGSGENYWAAIGAS